MRALNIANVRFGRLVAKYWIKSTSHGRVWWCVCDCGGDKPVLARQLNAGHVKSCGCLKKVHLTDDQIARIRISREDYRSLGERYGVSHVTIANIRNRKNRWEEREISDEDS
jgi:hypothetical protein